jgi:hypothetical protein
VIPGTPSGMAAPRSRLGAVGVWRSLVARGLWVAEVLGSNPGAPIASWTFVRWGNEGIVSIVAAMVNEEDNVERRVERAVFETDRHLVVGDVTLPPAGYQSRFSDSLNRADLEFVALTNVEITSLLDGKISERPFIVLSKRHIRLSYPAQY